MILGTCPSGWNCPITTTAAGTTTATVAQWAQCGGFYSQNNFMFETQFLYLKGIGYTEHLIDYQHEVHLYYESI